MSYYVTHLDTDIWTNPDIPGVRDWIDEDGEVEIDCPNPDGCPGSFTLTIDGEEDDFDDLLEWLEDHNGTRRCKNCDEPLIGIRGDGDHDDDFVSRGWKSGP